MSLVTNLGSNICNGSFRHGSHSMKTGITRASSLGLLINRAGRCKDMFERLMELLACKEEKCRILLKREGHCVKARSKGLLHHTSNLHTKYWPLIPCNLDLAIDKLGPSSECDLISYSVEIL